MEGAQPLHPQASSSIDNELYMAPKSWIDMFYRVLTSPKKAFLSCISENLDQRKNTILGTLALILLVAIVSAFSYENNALLAVRAFSNIISTLANWLLLTLVLFVMAPFFPSANKSFSSACIVTGWAFLPYIFLLSISCFKHLLGAIYPVVYSIPFVWATYLEWLAFQTVLKIDRKQMLILILVVPPILTATYLFWLGMAFSLIAIKAASAI